MRTLEEKNANKGDNIRGYVMIKEGKYNEWYKSDDDSIAYSVEGGVWFDDTWGASVYFSKTFRSFDEAYKCFSELDPSWSFDKFSKYERGAA